jgi:hypothetical protein
MRSVERSVGRSRGPARRGAGCGRTIGRTPDERSTTKIAGAAVKFGFTWTFDCAGAPWFDLSDRSEQHAFRTGVLQQSCAPLTAGAHPGPPGPAYAGTVDTPMSATMSASAENAVLSDFTISILKHAPCQGENEEGGGPPSVDSSAGNPASAPEIARNAPQFAWHPAWSSSLHANPQ